MLVNDRYFTAEITEADRKELCTLLGLDKQTFLFVESVSDVLIRVDQYSKGQVETLLHISSRALLDKYASEKNISVIENASEEGKPALEGANKDLWEAALPYPFCKWGAKTRIRPAAFEAAVLQLREAILNLEKKMSGFEVGLISIAGPSNDLHLLLHFVRGKRIRLGIPHDFDVFLSTFRGASPTIAELEGYFGTTVAFTRVESSASYEENPSLESITASILNAGASIVGSTRGIQEESQDQTIQL